MTGIKRFWILMAVATLLTVEFGAAADVAKIVADAKARNQARIEKQSVWKGPTSGPPAAKDKRIVVVNGDSKNAIEAMFGQFTAEAAQKIGWTVTVIDGKGTVHAQVAAMNQAISMKADGIVISANADSVQASILEAKAMGIPVVGIHSSNVPGPDPERNLLFNITTSGTQIGNAMADYVIADSDGKGRAIILYDSLYAIAREKAEGMRDQLATCPDITILDYVNTPLVDVPRNLPQLASSWISRYGTPLYVLGIADYYFDFAIPTLRAGGVPPEDVKLLGSDGTIPAYDRVRVNDYQVLTIPEPYSMFGFMAVDALNRNFNGEEVVSFIPDVYIVTADNIHDEGGDQNMFIPSNDFEERYLKVWGIK